jgi:type I restriction enzyme R subunit
MRLLALHEASELGLTEFEHAFYTAVADNKSAKELMQHDKLRELAVDLLLTRFFLERDFNSSLSSFFNISKATFLCSMPYAFYTAVANNKSAKELMQHDKLRELAVVLTERVKQNASIDWTIKESVRAKLKVIIKRTLRQYGYPPDMQKLATDSSSQHLVMIFLDCVFQHFH